jgi:hypothetical protein
MGAFPEYSVKEADKHNSTNDEAKGNQSYEKSIKTVLTIMDKRWIFRQDNDHKPQCNNKDKHSENDGKRSPVRHALFLFFSFPRKKKCVLFFF